MKTIFTSTENSKTSEAHKFRSNLTGKLNLKNQKKHSFSQFKVSITHRKKSSQNTTIINLKFHHKLGMILLIYLMVLIQFLRFKITLNLSSKNTKF